MNISQILKPRQSLKRSNLLRSLDSITIGSKDVRFQMDTIVTRFLADDSIIISRTNLLDKRLTELAGTSTVENKPSVEPAFLFPGAKVSRFPPDELTRLTDRMANRDSEFGQTRVGRDNPHIPAGFTYLAQFLNHDALHKARRVGRPTDIEATRAPRLNLDSLYGEAPEMHPRLYEDAGPGSRRFRIGKIENGRAADLPRDTAGIATIPEPRNDNNLILAQLTALLMRFHNRLAERSGLGFAEVRQQVMFHYHSAIINDLLPRLLEGPTLNDLRKNGAKLYRRHKALFVPYEFSNAAFRLHTMSRNRYQINRQRYLDLAQVLQFTGQTDPGVFPLNPTLVVDWALFFPAPDSTTDPFLNFSDAIDPLVARALRELPITDLPDIVVRSLKLPFGRTPTLMLVDAHTNNGTVPSAQNVLKLLQASGYDLPAMTAAQIESGPISGLKTNVFTNDTPLFYYVLKEAEVLAEGFHLGPLGSRIVGETIIGLLEQDEQSLLHRKSWRPSIRTVVPSVVTMSDIVSFVESA